MLLNRKANDYLALIPFLLYPTLSMSYINETVNVLFHISAVLLLGVYLLIISSLRYRWSSRMDVLVVCLIALVFFLIYSRFDQLSFATLKLHLSNVYTFLPYLVIPAYYLASTKSFFQRLNFIINLGCIGFIIAVPFALGNKVLLENLSKYLGYPALFLILVFPYLSVKSKVLSVVSALYLLLIAFVYARRNILLSVIITSLLSVFLHSLYYQNIIVKIRRLFAYSISFTLVALLPILVDHDLYSGINERKSEDTRSVVFLYFWDGIKESSFLGKGVDGRYFCPIYSEEGDLLDDEYRRIIESGFLQLILQGGFLTVFLYVFILFYAIYLGIFKTTNHFTKAASLYLVLTIFEMAYAGLPSFSLRHGIVWICVGTCSSSYFREMTDVSFKKELMCV